MTKRLKYTLAPVLLLLAGIPVVYLTLAWHVEDPLRLEAARVRDGSGDEKIRLHFTNLSAFPVTLCGMGHDGASRTFPIAWLVDPTVIRPGQTHEISYKASTFALSPDQPQRFECTWCPPGHLIYSRCCTWLRVHLPATLADRVPVPSMRLSRFTATLGEGPPAP